ncbi:MAG: hypothetical protein WBC78_24180 [Candidatus Sulfotelmatobacter sp.]
MQNVEEHGFLWPIFPEWKQRWLAAPGVARLKGPAQFVIGQFHPAGTLEIQFSGVAGFKITDVTARL